MFDSILDFLKRLPSNAGLYLRNVCVWLWDNLIPNTVKTKFKEMLPAGGLTLAGMVSFVFNILLHWYFYIVVAGIVVVYRLFKALESSGILARFTKIMYGGMEDVFRISNDCFPLLADYKEFMQCIGIG
jgi:Fe2+ transport system protein B